MSRVIINPKFQPPSNCPSCGSTNIFVKESKMIPHNHGTELKQKWVCIDCEFKWKRQITLPLRKI